MPGGVQAMFRVKGLGFRVNDDADDQCLSGALVERGLAKGGVCARRNRRGFGTPGVEQMWGVT